MKPRGRLLFAFALALAATPVVAAEAESAQPAEEAARPETAVPSDSGTPRIRHVVESLHRLRLRPGADSFDVTETSRGRPHANAE